MIKKIMKDFSLELAIILICLFLFITGVIFNFLPSVQMVFKKTFLVAWWYLLTYTFRKIRIGTLEWEREEDKKTYYFILLLSSAIIFALG